MLIKDVDSQATVEPMQPERYETRIAAMKEHEPCEKLITGYEKLQALNLDPKEYVITEESVSAWSLQYLAFSDPKIHLVVSDKLFNELMSDDKLERCKDRIYGEAYQIKGTNVCVGPCDRDKNFVTLRQFTDNYPQLVVGGLSILPLHGLLYYLFQALEHEHMFRTWEEGESSRWESIYYRELFKCVTCAIRHSEDTLMENEKTLYFCRRNQQDDEYSDPIDIGMDVAPLDTFFDATLDGEPLMFWPDAIRRFQVDMEANKKGMETYSSPGELESTGFTLVRPIKIKRAPQDWTELVDGKVKKYLIENIILHGLPIHHASQKLVHISWHGKQYGVEPKVVAEVLRLMSYPTDDQVRREAVIQKLNMAERSFMIPVREIVGSGERLGKVEILEFQHKIASDLYDGFRDWNNKLVEDMHRVFRAIKDFDFNKAPRNQEYKYLYILVFCSDTRTPSTINWSHIRKCAEAPYRLRAVPDRTAYIWK